MERKYSPLPEYSNEEIEAILQREDPNELALLSLSVGQFHPHWKTAQDLCAKLSEHPDPRVRANAVLGLAYIARTKRKLEKHIVKPIVLRELKQNREYDWRIRDAISDINGYMGWRIGRKPNV